MTPGFQHYNPPAFFTATSMISGSRCPRRWFYQTGCRLEQSGGPHIALTFGEAYHAGLPYAINQDLDRSMAEFNKVFTGQIPTEKENPVVAKMMYCHAMAAHQPRAAIFRLVKPPPTLNISDRVSEYEIPFAIQVPDLELPIIGRIDGLGTHRDTREHWGLEYKTASEVSSRILSAFDMNPQILTYALALKLFVPDLRGFFVEIHLKSKTRTNVEVKPVELRDNLLNDHAKWLSFWGNMLLVCQRDKDFPKWFSGCNPYASYGMPGYTCQYQNLCYVDDWTTLRSLYSLAKPHVPFRISDNISADDVKLVELPTEPALAQPEVELEQSAATTGITINGQTY